MNAVVEQHPKGTSLVAKFAGRYSVDPTKILPTLKATAFRLDSGSVSDEQMMALLIVADQYQLNPFTKEIFAYPDKHKGIVPVVSVDGWCRIINDNPQMDGIEFVYGPVKGAHFEWIECVIYRKDRSKPIRVREFWDEVAKSTGPWSSHGNRMHRHKALIQCGRVAFGFGGIYDEDEAKQIIERDVTPPGAGANVVQMPTARTDAKPEIVDVEVVSRAGEEPAGTQPPGDQPTGESIDTSTGEVKKTEARPMTAGQRRILSAKLTNAALSMTDFTAKWEKPLVAEDGTPNFTFSDFDPICAWITSRAG